MSRTEHMKIQQKSTPRRRIAARVIMRQPGASPGTLTPLQNSTPATVTVLRAGGGQPCAVTTQTHLADLPRPAAKGVTWVRIAGLGSLEPLLRITEFYGISHLALEDTLSPGRTKLEIQGEYAFFVLQGAPDPVTRSRGDHLTLFCKPGLVLTFEDRPSALVAIMWERLQNELPLLMTTSHLAEMLTYMMLDILVNGFFPHLDQKDEALAELEELVSDHVPRREELNRLHQVKRDLITLRRLFTPFKEVCAEVQKYHTPESFKEMRPFFNDLGDHVLQVGELLDTYYEVAKSLDDISQRAISNRMNDIVRVLTIISTVFMPLSFLAGLYGMNFDTRYPLNMPELSHPYGYILVLLGMGCVVSGMLWFFKRKGWL